MQRKIVLSNFMAHAQTELNLVDGLTVLVGPNNIGKSTVAVALHYVKIPFRDAEQVFYDLKSLSIEQLQTKYDELNRRKIEAETRHRDASDQLQKLRSQALATWGTEDLDELKLKLVKLQEENEARRAKYQSDLQGIEAKLHEVDEKYQSLREIGRNSE